MVKSLAVGFGMVTALAVAGSMTPIGQSMLGQRHSPDKVAPVSSIWDKPAAIPGPTQSLVAPSAVPATPPAAQRQAAPRPQATSAPRASQPAPPQSGTGGVAGIANILLNLPQILDQTHVGPSHGPDSWSQPAPADPGSAKPHKRRHAHGHEQEPNKEEAGENN